MIETDQDIPSRLASMLAQLDALRRQATAAGHFTDANDLEEVRDAMRDVRMRILRNGWWRRRHDDRG